MANLTAGYFTATYFPSRYWQTGNQYFTEYGSGAAPSAPASAAAGTFGPPARMGVKRRKWLLIRKFLEAEKSE